MTKRHHTPKTKAAIALEAITGEKPIAEISKDYNIHPSQIHAWKAQALQGLEGIFASSKVDCKLQDKTDNHIEVLEKKIGQLVVECDFLKKKCSNLPLRSALK
jgi:transposase